MWSLNLFPGNNHDTAAIWKMGCYGHTSWLSRAISCFPVLYSKFRPNVKLVGLFSSKDIIIVALGALSAPDVSRGEGPWK